jgi:nucleoside-diphosphate-sugar epimerase
MNKHTLFITGASGYVGFMLVDIFAKRDDVQKIIALDKEAEPLEFKTHPNKDKIVFLQDNTASDTWVEKVKAEKPDVVIHPAWQIREIYGNRPLSWKWNIDGSNKVFDFCFQNNFVKKFVYFSTVASYGAFPENTLEYRFTEQDPFRKTNYLYAEEKRIAEENLEKKYKEATEKNLNLPVVSIVRPAAITGPRGRYTRIRFGLQSALSGQLKGGVYSVVAFMTRIVPATKKWLRQYIHEDDVVDIVQLLSFDEKVNHKYEAYNICPPGDAVLAPDMAKAVNKKVIIISPQIIRVAFFVFWHLTRGKIPTAEGSWKGYSYPIAVDGSKLTKMYGYKYFKPSKEAFVENVGRYKV